MIRAIANYSGMDFDTLIGGEYKILLEPIAYYKFEGVMIATTATEAVLYDEIVGGQLRYWMGSLTAKNLPLSMFLETPDLGYPAWSGATNKNASNADIKSSLGLGIVRFEEQPEDPVITTYDYEYRVNTEVITAVDVSGGQSDPDNPARVTFTIDGRDYHVDNVYYPEGDSQLAWVRWTTPDTPQDMWRSAGPLNTPCSGCWNKTLKSGRWLSVWTTTRRASRPAASMRIACSSASRTEQRSLRPCKGGRPHDLYHR